MRTHPLRWQRVTDSMLVVATLIEVGVFAAIAPRFFSVANAVNVALSIAVTGILAVGMTAVILTAGIDLSVGSVVALTGVTGAIAASHGFMPATMALLVAVLVGVATGVVNGTLTAYLQVPAFVSTLAMLTIARGLAFIVSGGRSIGDLPPSFSALGVSVVFGIPAPVLVTAVVMIAGAFVLGRTVFGRHVYAIGGNTEAA